MEPPIKKTNLPTAATECLQEATGMLALVTQELFKGLYISTESRNPVPTATPPKTNRKPSTATEAAPSLAVSMALLPSHTMVVGSITHEVLAQASPTLQSESSLRSQVPPGSLLSWHVRPMQVSEESAHWLLAEQAPSDDWFERKG